MTDSTIKAAPAPDPIELRSFEQPTTYHQPEIYWRWGYVIDGGKPVMVDKHARSEKQAMALATAKARDVTDRLKAMHAPGTVSAWVQSWRIDAVVAYSDPVVTPL